MKMEKLDFPYSEDYTAGYLRVNRENRRTLTLKHKDGSLHCTQFARYLVACKLGRYLKPEETVDHIDNDKTNDSIDNLTVLTWRDNIIKSAKKCEHGHSGMIKKGCKCPLCIEAKRAQQNKYLEKHRDEVNARRKERRRKTKITI